MEINITQVDTFTHVPFSGNPAAVVILPVPRQKNWMQSVAREMNLSETAFLIKRGAVYDLRWFSPQQEVDLCGHATLASAHVLWEEGHLQLSETIVFETKSGLLTAEHKGDWIDMDFPAEPAKPAKAPAGLEKALGVSARTIGRNRFDYLVEVDSEEIVRCLVPDFTLLKTLDIRGVMVTSRMTDPKYDFISRFFAPAVGIPEDPVTGSAHCCLGPFWGTRLGKKRFLAYQASERGGEVRVHLKGNRVVLGGQAVTVLRGRLLH